MLEYHYRDRQVERTLLVLHALIAADECHEPGGSRQLDQPAICSAGPTLRLDIADFVSRQLQG